MSIIENTCNCRKNYVGLPREQITSKSIWFRIHVSFSIPINSNLPLFSCSIIFLRDDMKNGSNEVDRGSYTLPQNLLFYPPISIDSIGSLQNRPLEVQQEAKFITRFTSLPSRRDLRLTTPFYPHSEVGEILSLKPSIEQFGQISETRHKSSHRFSFAPRIHPSRTCLPSTYRPTNASNLIPCLVSSRFSSNIFQKKKKKKRKTKWQQVSRQSSSLSFPCETETESSSRGG